MSKAILFVQTMTLGVLLTIIMNANSQESPWSPELTGEVLTPREQAEIDEAWSEIDEVIEDLELELLEEEMNFRKGSANIP